MEDLLKYSQSEVEAREVIGYWCERRDKNPHGRNTRRDQDLPFRILTPLIIPVHRDSLGPGKEDG